MRRALLPLAIAFGAALVAAGVRSQASAPPVGAQPLAPPVSTQAYAARARLLGDIVHGRELFLANCTSCHGLSGSGDGAGGALLGRARPRDLTDPSAMNARIDAELHAVIADGGAATGRSRYMPPFGATLGALDVWDVVAYVRTLHPSVDDVLPTAARWTAHESVAPRVTWFEAFDRRGGAIGSVAFEAVRGGWTAVALAPHGTMLTRRAFGLPDGADDATRRLAARVVEGKASLERDRARIAARLTTYGRAPWLLDVGERLYLERCEACHRSGARNLADPQWQRSRGDHDIADAIRRGGTPLGLSDRMPAWSSMPEHEVAALVEHIRAMGKAEGGR